MTNDEATLFETTTPTDEQIREACLSVHGLPSGERYRRLARIAQRVRTFAPEHARAVVGFQVYGFDSVLFGAL